MVRLRMKSRLSGKHLAMAMVVVSIPTGSAGVFVLFGLGWCLVTLAVELALLGLVGTDIEDERP